MVPAGDSAQDPPSHSIFTQYLSIRWSFVHSFPFINVCYVCCSLQTWRKQVRRQTIGPSCFFWFCLHTIYFTKEWERGDVQRVAKAGLESENFQVQPVSDVSSVSVQILSCTFIVVPMYKYKNIQTLDPLFKKKKKKKKKTLSSLKLCQLGSGIVFSSSQRMQKRGVEEKST